MAQPFLRSINPEGFALQKYGHLLVTVFMIIISILTAKLIVYSSEQLLILFIVVTMAILCFAKTWTGLVLLLFLSPFHGFMRYTMGLSDTYTLWKELMVILLATAWLTKNVLMKKEKPTYSPATLPLLLFLSLVIIQLIRAPNMVQGLFGLRTFATYIPIYFVAASLCSNKKQIQSVVFMTIGIGVVTAAFGIWQHFVGLEGLENRGLANVGSNLATMGQLRVFSSFAGPEYLGLYMVLTIILGVALLNTNLSKRRKVLLALGISVMFIGLVFTLFRVEWFLLGSGLILLSALAKKSRFVVLLLVAVISAATLFPPFVAERARMTFGPEDLSFQERKIVYLEWNLADIITHPLGGGLGQTSGRSVYMRVTERSAESELIGGGFTESGFVNVAIELGILGLVLLLWFFVRIIKHGLYTFYRLTDPFLKWLAAAIVVFVTVIALGSIVSPAMEVFPAGDLYFWFLVGLLVRLEGVQKHEALDLPKS